MAPCEPNDKWPYRASCHMRADTTEELVTMARKIGLKPGYIQHPGKPTEHFDLTASKRQQALGLGAVSITRREGAQLTMKKAGWERAKV
jgi:hypothetical protein